MKDLHKCEAESLLNLPQGSEKGVLSTYGNKPISMDYIYINYDEPTKNKKSFISFIGIMSNFFFFQMC